MDDRQQWGEKEGGLGGWGVSTGAEGQFCLRRTEIFSLFFFIPEPFMPSTSTRKQSVSCEQHPKQNRFENSYFFIHSFLTYCYCHLYIDEILFVLVLLASNDCVLLCWNQTATQHKPPFDPVSL